MPKKVVRLIGDDSRWTDAGRDFADRLTSVMEAWVRYAVKKGYPVHEAELMMNSAISREVLLVRFGTARKVKCK